MKRMMCILIGTFICHQSIIAQEQVIPDPYLHVVKKDDQITVSYPEDDYSVTFRGDSVYRIKPSEIMVVISEGILGIFDPWDLYMAIEPQFTSVEPFNEETLMVKKKGKYGLYSYWDGYFEELLPAKYDEIILLVSHGEGIVYKIRKGKKWGAGDCESLETKIAYDEIDWLTGSCADNYFRAKKDGKSGLVATWSYGDYVYPPEFDKISFTGNHLGNGYFILKKGNKWDVVNDNFLPFEPRYDNVHVVEMEGLIRISMEANGEISTLSVIRER